MDRTALQQLAETALKQLLETDSAAVLESIFRADEPLVAGQVCNEALCTLYWKKKDLQSALAIGRGGMLLSLASAVRCEKENAELARKLTLVAQQIAYNMASFTWPGWNEPGIAITASDCAIGLDAARTSLRLVAQLNKGAIALSRGKWMLAGHELSAGNAPAARAHYAEAAQHADEAKSEAETLLCRGFEKLAELVGSPSDKQARKALEEIKQRLPTVPDGKDFVQQIETAEEVYRK